MTILALGPLVQEIPNLQDRDWPVSEQSGELNSVLAHLLSLDLEAQRQFLAKSRGNSEEHGQLINEGLGQIYDYIYGYSGAPCYNTTDDELEIKFQQTKILLERELINWLQVPDFPRGLNQMDAARYLHELFGKNSGVFHELYEYIATSASKEAVLTFLFTESVRTEVVDDEVAFMIIGTQGSMKKASVGNCWDECGKGELDGFHTYWLRMLLEQTNTWEKFAHYRSQLMPWFAKLTSNAFNVLLTRPGYKYAAYGNFTIGESWVPPHFEKILQGMKRVGLDHPNNTIYFEKHVHLDPYHTKDLLDGFAYQEPALTVAEVDQVLFGAHVMIAAATKQYERMLDYLPSR
ncbi:MAG: iron-containing redox enzyme family protein [Crocosphaera sp.]